MRNKNKFNIFAIVLYVLVLVILSFISKYIINMNLSIASFMSKDIDTINLIADILKYVELFIFYVGLGIMVTIVCIDYLDTFKSIVFYSIICCLFLAVLATTIKSFFIDLDFIAVIDTFVSVLIGFGIEILIKIKQIRGGKYENSKN